MMRPLSRRTHGTEGFSTLGVLAFAAVVGMASMILLQQFDHERKAMDLAENNVMREELLDFARLSTDCNLLATLIPAACPADASFELANARVRRGARELKVRATCIGEASRFRLEFREGLGAWRPLSPGRSYQCAAY